MKTDKTDGLKKTIGRNIRTNRMMRGLSQEVLGTRIGVTFQQFQKYENAANHVTAARLWHIAKELGVPVEVFYQDQETATEMNASTKESLALLRDFNAIECHGTRRQFAALLKAMAKANKAAAPLDAS